MRFAVIACAALCAAPLRAQTVIPRHPQQSGATDWFGEHILKIRGGSRVELEPRVAGHLALFRVTPLELRFIRLDSLAAGRQRFEVAQDTALQFGQRVPFVVTSVGGSGAVPAPSRPAAPMPPPQRVRDGILVIVTDVALDSAELMARLARLPAVHPDCIADHVGQLLVGRRTAMWAAYYEPR